MTVMYEMGYIKRRQIEFCLAATQNIVLFWWYSKAKIRDSSWNTQVYLQARGLNFVPMYIGQKRSCPSKTLLNLILISVLVKPYLAQYGADGKYYQKR